ncbi:MAG: GNAT family N-acetyltransferase [Marinilabiliales bacterium]|nr:MAG: GNAT family N-acetyltransferase [Marinilabiliales bacterium]
MDIRKLKIKKLSPEGVKTLVQWAAEEGWNPGPHDAEVFYATDQDGFYGYFMDDELIAGGAIVSYAGKFGFMGLFIVKPQYRSLGIGRQLWYQRRDMLLKRLDPDAAIGMDGVVAMQPFYEKGGFTIAFRDMRYSRAGEKFEVNHSISTITNDDIPEIIDYDTKCFGVERAQFLIPWLQLPESKTFKYVENGGIKGFAITRKAMEGHKICPLFADNAIIAEELYRACLNAFPGESVFLDIPEVNKEAVALTEKYNARYVFECARMYYGTPPETDINNVFGITTFELG